MAFLTCCFLTFIFLFSATSAELLDFEFEGTNIVPQERRVDKKNKLIGTIIDSITNKYFRYKVFNPRDYYAVQKVLGLIRQELNFTEIETINKKEISVEEIRNDLSEIQSNGNLVPNKRGYNQYKYFIEENEYIEYLYKDTKNSLNSEIVVLNNDNNNKIIWRIKKVDNVFIGVVNICYDLENCMRLTESKFYNDSEHMVFGKSNLIHRFVKFEHRKEYSIMFDKVDKQSLVVKDMHWNYINMIYKVILTTLNASRDDIVISSLNVDKSNCMEWEKIALEIISSKGCVNEKKIYFLTDEEENWQLIIRKSQKIDLTILDTTTNHATNIVCDVEITNYRDELTIEKLKASYPTIMDSKNNFVKEMAKISLINKKSGHDKSEIRTDESFLEIMVYDFEEYNSKYANIEVLFESKEALSKYQIVKETANVVPEYFILINKSDNVFLYRFDQQER